MGLKNVGGYTTIDAFVRAKLARFEAMDRSFASLFELMFSERENIFYEKSEGYKITVTTYDQAHRAILARAAGMKAVLSHIPAGSVVGLHAPNGLDWIELFWALLRCGYRPLLMNLRLSDGLLEHALESSGAAAVISGEKTFSVPTIAPEDIPALQDVPVEGEFGTEILLMSSGTTENLKICAYSAEEFYYQVKNSWDVIRRSKQMARHYDGQLKLLLFLPLYHIFGLVAVYIWFAFFSRTFVQLNDMAPQTILNTIRRHKVTHIFAVPLFWETVWQQAMHTIKGRGEKTCARFERGLGLCRVMGDVPVLGNWFCRAAFRQVRENLFGESVQFMITGGSMIAPQALEFFNAVGYHLANGYGMTELGITSVELSNRKKVRNAGFIGKPLSSVEYRIGDNGHLQVRGKSVAKYIIQNGVVTRSGDWFDTGDLAQCVGGRYRLLGRSDDLIVTADGENLNPNLIERQLSAPGAGSLCLVGGEKTTLLISVKRTTAETLDRLERDLRAQIEALHLSSQINRLLFISDPLLKDEEFKLNRRRLRRELEQGSLHPVCRDNRGEREEETDALWLQIRDMFALALNRPAEEIAGDSDFFLDEGGSSLEYFAMIAQMQQEFSVTIPLDGEPALHSVRAIYQWIKEAVEYVD